MGASNEAIAVLQKNNRMRLLLEAILQVETNNEFAWVNVSRDSKTEYSLRFSFNSVEVSTLKYTMKYNTATQEITGANLDDLLGDIEYAERVRNEKLEEKRKVDDALAKLSGEEISLLAKHFKK